MDNLHRIRQLMSRPPTLEELLSGAPVAIICADERGLIIDLNRRAEVLVGCLSEEAFGAELGSILSPPPTLEIRPSFQTSVISKLGGEIPAIGGSSYVDLGEDRVWVISLRERGGGDGHSD